MSSADTIPLMLLALHGLALGMGIVFLSLIYAMYRRAIISISSLRPAGNQNSFLFFPPFLQRPTSWLAVRSANPKIVQAALGLTRSTLDSWSEGMTGGREFFISPQVHGWVIVTGSRSAEPQRRRGRVFSFFDHVEPPAGARPVFSCERNFASSRLGADGRGLRDARVCVGGRNGLEPGRQDIAGN